MLKEQSRRGSAVAVNKQVAMSPFGVPATAVAAVAAAGESIFLPLNSLMLDTEEYKLHKRLTLVTDHENSEMFTCPYENCNQTYKLHGQYKHLKYSHLDLSRPRLLTSADKRYKQPKEFKGTSIFIDKITKRAICTSSLILLRRHEVMEHIHCCPGCADWKRLYKMPALVTVSRAPIDPENESSLPGAIVTNKPSKRYAYREHEPFVLLQNRYYKTKDVKGTKTSVTHRARDHEVECDLNVVVDSSSKLGGKIVNVMSYSHQLAIHFAQCIDHMDACTLGLQWAMIDRIGTARKWVDYKGSNEAYFWFATNPDNGITQLPYLLQDGIEVEARLSGFSGALKFDTDAAMQARIKVANYMNVIAHLLLFKTAKNGEVTIFNLKFRNNDNEETEDARTIYFNEKGQMMVLGKPVPWCIAELFARWLLIIRPLESKYNSICFNSDSLLPNISQDPKRYDVFVRTLEKYCDGEMSKREELRREFHQGVDFTEANQTLMKNGMYLVKYYDWNW